jgi:hypothetical protein
MLLLGRQRLTLFLGNNRKLHGVKGGTITVAAVQVKDDRFTHRLGYGDVIKITDSL